MNKSQLVAVLAAKHKVSKKLAGDIFSTLISTIQTAVKKGNAVRVVGFGTFKKAIRKARKGINPSTGEKIKIPRKLVPKFSASKTWKMGR